MSLPTSRPWGRQPPPSVPAASLPRLGKPIFLYRGGTPRDDSDAGIFAPISITAGDLASSNGGLEATNFQAVFDAGAEFLSTNSFATVVGVARIPILRATADSLFSASNLSDFSDEFIQVGVNAAENIFVQAKQGGQSARTSTLGGKTYGAGEVIKFCAVWAGNNFRAIYNETGLTGNTTASGGTSLRYLRIGQLAATSAQSLIAVYDGAADPETAARLARNPWGLFQPRRIFVPVAAAGGSNPVVLTTTLSAVVQAARTATSGLSAAVRLPTISSAAASAAVRRAAAAQTDLAAAVRAARAATAALTAATRAPGGQTAALTSAVSLARAATASLTLAAQSAAVRSASVSAALRAPGSASASLEAQVQAGTVASLSASAAVLRAAVAAAGVDVPVQAARTASASLNAALQLVSASTAALTAAVARAEAASASATAYVQAGATVASAVSSAVQAARTASASASAAVAEIRFAAADLAAAIASRRALDVTLDLSVSVRRVATAALSVFVQSGGGGSADPADVWNYVLANGKTAAQTLIENNEMLRVVMAAVAGTTAGIGTATETYFGTDGTTPRITATFDAQGNRTNVVVDGTDP